MDLSAFLLARIAEDEASAQGAIKRPAPPDADAIYVAWTRYDTGWVPSGSGKWNEGSELFARYNPVRVLAECQARRQAIEEAWADHLRIEGEWGHCRGREELTAANDYPPVVQVLAAVYADHPDYDPAWRP